MDTEKQIVMTSVERALVKRMGQVVDEGRINSELATFTSTDMARAIRAATGVPVNYRDLGALLDRMGVVANRRDYRREMHMLNQTLPEWLTVADSQPVSQIRMPTPPRVRERARDKDFCLLPSLTRSDGLKTKNQRGREPYATTAEQSRVEQCTEPRQPHVSHVGGLVRV